MVPKAYEVGRRGDSGESAEEARIFAKKDFTLRMRFDDPLWLPRPMTWSGRAITRAG
ncbi:hypothetical protein AB0E27_38190 [Streptomyces sparsogenes]|uniref:hypothetical protein n=1 Tax=Streptomyces sparsogenes TaxID=67365 RepID=UPI0034059B82